MEQCAAGGRRAMATAGRQVGWKRMTDACQAESARAIIPPDVHSFFQRLGLHRFFDGVFFIADFFFATAAAVVVAAETLSSSSSSSVSFACGLLL